MIEITETAARKIRTLMAKQGIDDGGLRVGVKGGGCSGLSYTFAWEKEARFGDEVFEGADGAKLYVDKKSLLFLNGTVLDYDTDPDQPRLRLQQPEREGRPAAAAVPLAPDGNCRIAGVAAGCRPFLPFTRLPSVSLPFMTAPVASRTASP